MPLAHFTNVQLYRNHQYEDGPVNNCYCPECLSDDPIERNKTSIMMRCSCGNVITKHNVLLMTKEKFQEYKKTVIPKKIKKERIFSEWDPFGEEINYE